MTKGLMSFFFNTPVLHHSIIPRPRLSRTFGNFQIAFLLVIITLNAVVKKIILRKLTNPQKLEIPSCLRRQASRTI
jgi:hypothetical protein